MMIRPANAADVPAMMSLDRLSSSAAHWTEQQYQDLFEAGADGPERLVIVAAGLWSDITIPSGSADRRESILGFLVARHLAPEWELENIVVAESARRNGLGRRLLEALLTRACETNSEAVFLEVRESNASARGLYERAGFEQKGRRKAYYAAPQEDAILYRRILRQPFS